VASGQEGLFILNVTPPIQWAILEELN
jgi:hypothetical protein